MNGDGKWEEGKKQESRVGRSVGSIQPIARIPSLSFIHSCRKGPERKGRRGKNVLSISTLAKELMPYIITSPIHNRFSSVGTLFFNSLPSFSPAETCSVVPSFPSSSSSTSSLHFTPTTPRQGREKNLPATKNGAIGPAVRAYRSLAIRYLELWKEGRTNVPTGAGNFFPRRPGMFRDVCLEGGCGR